MSAVPVVSSKEEEEKRDRREQEKEPQEKGEGAIVGHLSASCSSTTASSPALSGGEGVRK